MGTVRINGVTMEKLSKQRRVEEDQILPITLPLSQAIEEELVGVTPEDAWLPLAIAFINRLQRLWNIVSGGPYLIARLTGDEHLYQVMRTSFFNVFQEREDDEVTQKAIKARLPKTLPTTGKLASFNRWDQAKYDDKFESIESLLIGDALRYGIPSDTRTVEDALKGFDVLLDRMQLLHHQHALDEADRLGHTDTVREELRRAIRSLQRRLLKKESTYLALAVELVARLRSIWELLYPDTRDLRRYPGDEAAYQAYRTLLMASLNAPEYRDVQALASEVLPRLLPLSDELVATNPLFGEMPGRLERLRNEIVALAFRLHEPVTIDYAEEPDLDEAFEEQSWEWDALRKTVGRERSSLPSGSSPSARSSRRGGRPRIGITYDVASQIYHDLLGEQIDEGSDRIAPVTYRRLRDAYLTLTGHAISEETVGNRVKQWRKDGLPWPPLQEPEKPGGCQL